MIVACALLYFARSRFQIMMTSEAAHNAYRARDYLSIHSVPWRLLKSGCSLDWCSSQRDRPPHDWSLCAFGPRIVCPVESLNDLEGFVAIKSAPDALEFIRLKTNNPTCRCFGPTSEIWNEILTRSQVPKDFFYGTIPKEDFSRMFRPDGFYGVISDSTYQKLQLQKPIIKRKGANYVITRQILRWLSSKPEATTVSEEVTPLGGYRLLELKPLNDDRLKSIDWYIMRTFK